MFPLKCPFIWYTLVVGSHAHIHTAVVATPTLIGVHLVEGIGVVGQHLHVRTELLDQSLNDHLCGGRVRHTYTLGGNLLRLSSFGVVILEVESHDPLKLEVLFGV